MSTYSRWFAAFILVSFGVTAKAESVATYVLPSGIQAVVYTDANRHLDQVSYASGVWFYNDLTALANAPVVAPGTNIATYVLPSGIQAVAFTDQNQRLGQVSYSSGVWFYNDLTYYVNAPVAALGTSIATYVLSSGTQAVVFTDANQHLGQVFYASGVWFYNDLTALANAPPPVGLHPPSGTVQIQASPNPLVVTDGSGVGQVVITYSAPGINDAQVFINNNLLCANGAAGSCQATNVSNGTVFSVREPSGLILAATTITVSTPKASLVALDGTVFLPNGNTANPTLSYAAAGASNVAIYANGALVCQGGSSGTCQTSNIANGTVFTMNDANTGAQLSSLTFNTLPASSNYCEVQ